MKYGYCRCSTNETKQDIERQVRELKSAGAENVVTEFEHGDAETKAELDNLFSIITEGDTVIVTEVSRLSRSTQQLCKLIEQVQKKHICLEILNSVKIDCRNGEIDPMTKAFLQMAGVFSELELSMIRARVKSGMANAKAKGKQIGRPTKTREDVPEAFIKLYPLYANKQMNKVQLAGALNLSRPTLDKYIKLYEQDYYLELAKGYIAIEAKVTELCKLIEKTIKKGETNDDRRNKRSV